MAGTPTRVLIGGHGLWADALARVLIERGAGVRTVAAARVADAMLRERADVVVVGPPLAPADLVRTARDVRTLAGRTRVALLAAVAAGEPIPTARLVDAGFDGSYSTDRVGELSEQAMRASGLRCRHGRRAPLRTSVAIMHARGLFEATTLDVNESGLGVEGASDVPKGEFFLCFDLPGSGRTVQASAELVWCRHLTEPFGFRLGVHFTSLRSEDEDRLRAYLFQAGA